MHIHTLLQNTTTVDLWVSHFLSNPVHFPQLCFQTIIYTSFQKFGVSVFFLWRKLILSFNKAAINWSYMTVKTMLQRFLFPINAVLLIKESWKKIMVSSKNNIHIFSTLIWNIIRTISDGWYDTEDWSSDCWNTTWTLTLHKWHFKIYQIIKHQVTLNCNISQYCCFYCIADQIIAALWA